MDNKQSLRDIREQSMLSSDKLTQAITSARKLAEDFRPMSIVIIGDHPISGVSDQSSCQEISPELPMSTIAKMTKDANPDVVIIDGDTDGAVEILKQLTVKAVKVFLTSRLNGSLNSVREFAKVVVFKPVTLKDLPWLSASYMRKCL